MVSRGSLKGYGLIVVSIACQIAALVFIKIAATHMIDDSFYSLLSNQYYYYSLFFLFIQALVWPRVLSKMDLSVAYSLTCLIYPCLFIIGTWIFGERINIHKIIASSLIVFGSLMFQFPFKKKRTK